MSKREQQYFLRAAWQAGFSLHLSRYGWTVRKAGGRLPLATGLTLQEAGQTIKRLIEVGLAA